MSCWAILALLLIKGSIPRKQPHSDRRCRIILFATGMSHLKHINRVNDVPCLPKLYTLAFASPSQCCTRNWAHCWQQLSFAHFPERWIWSVYCSCPLLDASLKPSPTGKCFKLQYHTGWRQLEGMTESNVMVQELHAWRDQILSNWFWFAVSSGQLLRFRPSRGAAC